MTGVRRLAALVAAALVLTGCGVPQDDEPRALDPAAAPFRAQERPVAESDGEGRVAMYFVRDGRLVLTTRRVQSATSLQGLLELLVAGPTAEEQATGRISALPPGLTVEDVTLRNGTAVVDLGGPEEVIARAPALAYAQIVWTLTQGQVRGVRFRYEGIDRAVPAGNGSLTEAPLTRADYLELVATPAPAASTEPTGDATPAPEPTATP